jgi:hypothetical protein
VPPRRLFRTAAVLVLAAVTGCSPTPAPTPSSAGAATAKVSINPSAVLLTGPGKTRVLTATALDASGARLGGTVTWRSSRPAVATIAADGTLSAASFGSTEITASVEGVTSAPILALVSTPAPGVTLVSDDQITSDPVDTDPNATPSADNTYRIGVTGISPVVGDVLLGTGGRALAGKVTAVEPTNGGATLTMALVPLKNLLPDLELDEVLDLTHADVVFPAEVTRLFDIGRDGNTFTFTAKPDFDTLNTGAVAGGRLAAYHPGDSSDVQLAAGAQGTSVVPPFTDCAVKIDQNSLIPIKLSGPPTFKVTINPTLDLVWTKANGLERFVIHAQPTASVFAGIKVTAAFAGSIGCEMELFALRIPVGGPLSLILGGLIPIGVGVELAGTITVATMGIGTTVMASAKASAGLSCPGGSSCTFERSLQDLTLTATPTVDAPSLADLRLQPSLSAYAFLKASIGNPFLRSLRFDAFKAKIGGKLAADWAPQLVQILDPAYASAFRLSLEASAGVGTDLSGLLKLLGLPTFSIAELAISTDLAHSPTGTLSTDKPDYNTGDPANVTVAFDQANLSFLGLYDVTEVDLVRYSGGSVTVLGKDTASSGQTDFTFTFSAPDHVSAGELFAFVVTKLPPLDLFSLEVARQASGGRIVFQGLTVAAGQPSNRIYVVDSDGTNAAPITAGPTDLRPTWSPDGTKIAFERDVVTNSGAIGSSSIFVVNPDGSGLTQLTSGSRDSSPAWSPDGSRIAFSRAGILFVMKSDGSNPVATGIAGLDAGSVSWSPDSKRLVYSRTDPSVGAHRLFIANADGSGESPIITDACLPWGAAFPDWSPDGTKIAFLCDKQAGDSSIAIVSPSGGNVTTLFRNPTQDLYTFARWSPDGTQLALAPGGKGGIVTIGPNGAPGSTVGTAGAASVWWLDWGR